MFFLQQTHSTRVRISILAAFGESYVRDNPGAKFRLVTHEPRPGLTLIPPPDSEKRPISYKFMEAVQRLVPNFTKAELTKIYEKVGSRLHLNQLRRVFVVLSDDERTAAFVGSNLSGSNSVPVAANVRGGRGGRGAHSGPASGTRKRVAEPEVIQPTPSKSARGRL